eukprot:jgi/Psemu1/32574/gm1.32574_g
MSDCSLLEKKGVRWLVVLLVLQSLIVFTVIFNNIDVQNDDGGNQDPRFGMIATAATATATVTTAITTTAPNPNKFTRIALPSVFSDRAPTACHDWHDRCIAASETVAAAARAGIERLEKDFFPRSACEKSFHCNERQNQAWNVSSFAYRPLADVESKMESNYLVLHLPGTGSKPIDHRRYTETVAGAGYYVLALAHPSWPFAVANSDAYCVALAYKSSSSSSSSQNTTATTTTTTTTTSTSTSASASATASDCNTQLHESVVFGKVVDRSSEAAVLWPVPRDESIQSLATWALRELGWNQFLRSANNNNDDDGGTTTTATTTTIIDWSKVIATGHSQGASHAAYLTAMVPVAAAVLLSGPQEVVDASWMHQNNHDNNSGNHATTLRSLFALHERCGPDPVEFNYCTAYQNAAGIRYGVLERNSRAMGMTPDDTVGRNRSFFVQDCTPTTYCADPAQHRTKNSCYHNSNAFDSAPPCVRDLWKVLYQDLV